MAIRNYLKRSLMYSNPVTSVYQGWKDLNKNIDRNSAAISRDRGVMYSNAPLRNKIGAGISTFGSAINAPDFGIGRAAAAYSPQSSVSQGTGIIGGLPIPTDAVPTNDVLSNKGGGGGSLSPDENTFSQYYGGNLYGDYASYLNAVNSDAQAQYLQYKKTLDDAYSNGLITFENRNRALDVNRQNIQTQAQELISDYEKNMGELGKSRTAAQKNISGMFSRLSPDAQQSEEGVLAGEAENQYQSGVGELNTTKAKNEQAIARGLEGVDLARTDLQREQTQYGQDYANKLQGLDRSRQEQIDNTLNNYLQYLSSGGYNVNLAPISQGETITPQTAGANLAPYLQKIGKLVPTSMTSFGATVPRVKSSTSATPTIEDILSYLYAGG